LWNSSASRAEELYVILDVQNSANFRSLKSALIRTIECGQSEGLSSAISTLLARRDSDSGRVSALPLSDAKVPRCQWVPNHGAVAPWHRGTLRSSKHRTLCCPVETLSITIRFACLGAPKRAKFASQYLQMQLFDRKVTRKCAVRHTI